MMSWTTSCISLRCRPNLTLSTVVKEWTCSLESPRFEASLFPD